jgi:hypothetical protein
MFWCQNCVMTLLSEHKLVMPYQKYNLNFFLKKHNSIILFLLNNSKDTKKATKLSQPKSNLYKTLIVLGKNKAGFSITIQ